MTWTISQPYRFTVKALQYKLSDRDKIVYVNIMDTTHDHPKEYWYMFVSQANEILKESRVQLKIQNITLTGGPEEEEYQVTPWGGFTERKFFEKDIGKADINVWVLENIAKKNGYHIPRTNYVLLEGDANWFVLAHEVGHWGDLAHRAGPLDNVMCPSNNRGPNMTSWQKFLLWTRV